MPSIRNIQLGKQGVTDNFIESLRNQFKNCANVRISVLANARKSKEDVKKYSEDILGRLGKNFTARVVGFTIIIKKWRREMR